MNLASDALVQIAWIQLVQVTLVAVAVGLVVRIACRRRPHLAYALWMLVIIKSLTPPLWSSPTGVFSWLQVRTIARSAEVSAGDFAGMPSEEMPLAESTAQQPASNYEISASMDRKDFSLSSISAAGVALVIWLTGVAIMGAVVLVRGAQCIRLLRMSAIPVPESFRSRTDDLAKKIGLQRRVHVVVSSEPVGPAVFGVLRPTVILPARLLADKTWAKLEPLMAHELVHLRRRDTLAGGLQAVAQVLWWFHPLVWWSNREARRERERCCDQEVIARLGCRPSEYARGLLDVLESRSPLRRQFGLPATGSWSVTTKRLEEIMRNGKAHRCAPLRICVGFVIGALLILPGAGLTLDSFSRASEHRSAIEGQQKSVPADEDATDSEAERPAQAPKGGAHRTTQPVAQTKIAGQCIDSTGTPVVGCQVLLYRQSYDDHSFAQLAQVSSKRLGRFEFEPVATIGPQDLNVRYFIIAVSGQHAAATSIHSYFTKEPPIALRLILGQPASVTGRVVTTEGEPIVGAKLWVRRVIPKEATSEEPLMSQWLTFMSPIADWLTASDSEGNFTIEQLPEGARVTIGVLHPGYVAALPWYEYRVRIPAEMSIEVLPGSTIEGRVVYSDTGRPAGGVAVEAQGKNASFQRTTTDSKGEYRLGPLAADSYNIWAVEPEWTVRAHDSFKVGVGETRKAPDLQLVRGGFVVGRVVDVATGKPVKPGPISDIGLHGPSRPASGGAIETAKIRPDGTFRIRVAPGENYVYLRTGQFSDNPSWAAIDKDGGVTLGFSEVTRGMRNGGAILTVGGDRGVTLLVEEGQTREVEFKARRMTEEEIEEAKKRNKFSFSPLD